jgi:peptidyl-prolyl cis-trans isomerase A (cyclophilin A)
LLENRPRHGLRDGLSFIREATALAAVLVVWGIATIGGCARPTLRARLENPDHPEFSRPAPAVTRIRLETSKGRMMLEIHRDWSPHGADRFVNLVRHGYYDGARFFRIRAGFWAQFGIAGDPEIARIWRTRTIPDDPRRQSNVRGTIAYAFRDPNGRTTQVFINLRDNSSTHDPEPFVPFGRVVDGMDVADALFAEYGETAGGGIRAGRQDRLFAEGNAYLMREFPKLDYIIRARVVP